MKKYKEHPEVAWQQQRVLEELPLPLVNYPSFYGTFISFSEPGKGERYLCECSRQPLMHGLQLMDKLHEGVVGMIEYLGRHPYPDHLSDYYYKKMKKPQKFEELFQFLPGLCHRCNQKNPSLIWCHPMYYNKFVQRFGWYVRQTALRYGFFDLKYLPGICSPDIAAKIAFVKRCNQLDDFFDENRDLIEELYPVDFWTLEAEPVIAPALPTYPIWEGKSQLAIEKELEKLPEKLTRKEFSNWYPKPGLPNEQLGHFS